MEDLGLLEEWLENEKKLRPLLEQMRPLLERRLELEAKEPQLALLRSRKELLPSEASPSKISTFPIPDSRPVVLFSGSKEPLQGLPDRPVPGMQEFERLVARRKAQNRKKHEKEKKKKAEAKKQKENSEKDMEVEDLDKGKK